MEKRKSYLTNFSTSTLFIVLEQNYNELLELEKKYASGSNSLVKSRISQVKLTIEISKDTIINRYLNDGTSLINIAKQLLVAVGIKEKVYQELFTLKVLESDEIIPLELLEGAINKLELSELKTIICAKGNTVYGKIAIKQYDRIIFDVEEDVLEEYTLKRKLDRRREKMI